LQVFQLALPFSEALLHSLFSVTSCLRRICNQALKLRRDGSLGFGGSDSRNRRHRRFRGHFLPFRQDFLPFVYGLLASIQLRFPLSELLFGRGISFLARANQRKRNQQRQDKSFFHISGGLSLVNEENGGLMYVKRNLTLLRLWSRRSNQSNSDRFDVATPKTLKIGKNSQHRQTNNDDQHQ
jgi:hypothetical protein